MFWKKKSVANQKITDPKGVTAANLQLMVKYGTTSNRIGSYESKRFIELPFGVVKIDLPNLQKQQKTEETVELIMRCQYPEFKIDDASGNEVLNFLLWIKEQQEFIHKIEEANLQSEANPEMVAAGIHRLAEFGAYTTVDSLAKGDILKHKEIKAIPYFEVYQKLKHDKIMGEIMEKRDKILQEKARRKR